MSRWSRNGRGVGNIEEELWAFKSGGRENKNPSFIIKEIREKNLKERIFRREGVEQICKYMY